MKRELTTEAKNVLELLADGYIFQYDGSSVVVLKRGMDCSATTMNELVEAGFTQGFANGSGGKISEKGRVAIIKSFDEMGDGKVWIGEQA